MNIVRTEVELGKIREGIAINRAYSGRETAYVIMSVKTLKAIEAVGQVVCNEFLKSGYKPNVIFGVPIAIDDTLPFGEVKVCTSYE